MTLPKYFSPYSKPVKPTEPPKRVEIFEVVQTITLSNYSHEPFIPEGSTFIYIKDIDFDRYESNHVSNITIEFSNKK